MLRSVPCFQMMIQKRKRLLVEEEEEQTQEVGEVLHMQQMRQVGEAGELGQVLPLALVLAVHGKSTESEVTAKRA